MAKVLDFPHTLTSNENASSRAMQAIEQRFGVSFWEYMGANGKRSEETQAKIDRALRKEMFSTASKNTEQP